MFFGYFDPENIFLDNKIIIFRGELTDISAKKEALLGSVWLFRGHTVSDLQSHDQCLCFQS